MNKLKINIYHIIIFSLVLFKYLINYGVSNLVLYPILLFVSVILLLSLIRKKNNSKKILIFFIIIVIYVFVYKDVNLLISFIPIEIGL